MLSETKGINAFPKIWALGSKYAQGIFDTKVEITEKLDGSQFGFSKPGADLIVRSKGSVIDLADPAKLFLPAVDHVKSIEDLLDPHLAYYGEAICKNKHNTLTYTNPPKNHIALFAIYDLLHHEWLEYDEMLAEADRLAVDCVPLLFSGDADGETVRHLIGKESYLGGCTAEGVVVKAFKDIEIAGVMCPIHSAKYVTEEFKEKHSNNKEFRSGKSNTLEFFEQFNTTARFAKMVQKLKESGDYQGEPKEIGLLMKMLSADLEEECKEDVKDALWSMFRKEFLSAATKGFPEWYKRSLLDQA
jgi:hypothetical protein